MAGSLLHSLHVRNLALVESARLEFAGGLNVITGETGAGKSVLMGALRLLTGERADPAAIRAGADQASAEAVFDLVDPAPVDALLDDLGVDACEDGQLLLRRVVKAAGSSQARINNCSVTLAVMRRVGDLLLDLHGPYDHQSLLRPEAQLSVLDSYGRTGEASAGYAVAWQACRALELRRDTLLAGAENLGHQVDLLSFQVREIEQADLQPGEEAAIVAEHTLQANATGLLEDGGTAAAGLDEAFEAMVGVQRSLEAMGDKLPEGAGWYDEARSIAIQLGELSTDIRGVLNRIEADPARLEFLEERMATYRSLKRKFGPEVEDVLAQLEAARGQLHDLRHFDEERERIEAEIEAAQAELEKAGAALTKRRRAASKKLAKAITGHLHELGFARASFEVAVEPAEAAASGMDRVEFGFAPNVGEPMRPLRAIASSGEIARVMLACKAVLAEHDAVPLLVFDEIDANVGGEMGVAIGEKLRAVAEHHQLIAITHLPQVAVCGGRHLRVEKAVEADRTVTRVAALEGEERVAEISRMLGGRGKSREALAREMLSG